ncbi:MAG: GTP-binding protein, partial [Gemmatimonadota bacterium]|nr:GTP-binding protein [Gemmatimonadota bacterium]
AGVCVLVVDASVGMRGQDLRIAQSAWERGSGLVIAVTKWDLVEEKDTTTAVRGERQLVERARFLEAVPFLYVSSKTGQRARKVLDTILEVDRWRSHRVGTAEVNKVLEALVARNQPPQESGQEVRLYYGSQIGVRPPTFAIVVNQPDAIAESYRRYLEHGFREAWGFMGVQLRIKLRRKKSRR